VSHRDFANIAEGDTVIINSRTGRTLAHVAKVTKTQVTVDGLRFMRSDGSEYGGDQWHRKWIAIPNVNDIGEIKAEQRQKRAVIESSRLRNQIDTALMEITRSQRRWGLGLAIEAANDHLRRALETLQADAEVSQ
jgi:hypothetical protein